MFKGNNSGFVLCDELHVFSKLVCRVLSAMDTLRSFKRPRVCTNRCLVGKSQDLTLLSSLDST